MELRVGVELGMEFQVFEFNPSILAPRVGNIKNIQSYGIRRRVCCYIGTDVSEDRMRSSSE